MLQKYSTSEPTDAWARISSVVVRLGFARGEQTMMPSCSVVSGANRGAPHSNRAENVGLGDTRGVRITTPSGGSGLDAVKL